MKQASLYSTPHQVLIDLLKDLRLLARFTQGDVAKALGRPQSYVSDIERGQRGLDLFQVEELAAFYGHDLESFVQLLGDRKKAAGNPTRATAKTAAGSVKPRNSTSTRPSSSRKRTVAPTQKSKV